MVLFHPYDGRPPIEVTSTNDIREYMGDSLKGYGPIEIQEGKVLTNLYGQYICIGTITEI